MFRRLTFLAGLALVAVSTATAEPYWITYEGNDYPENEGWTRAYRNEDGWNLGGAERSVENGVLTLDTRRSDMICDYYGILRQVDPDPGEIFVAEWRLNVLEANRSMELGVWIARDDSPGDLVVEYLEDELWIGREHWSFQIEPHVFHTYRVESTDMVDYSLWVDGEHVYDGTFHTYTTLELFRDVRRSVIRGQCYFIEPVGLRAIWRRARTRGSHLHCGDTNRLVQNTKEIRYVSTNLYCNSNCIVHIRSLW